MRYIVVVKEVWEQPVSIEAESVDDAIRKVGDGEGTVLESEFEYSHSLDSETWRVYSEG